MIRYILLALTFLIFSSALLGQKGTVRGKVLDEKTGEPIIYGNVLLQGTTYGNNTDLDGFFSISGVPVGDYTLEATYIGYDTVTVDVKITDGALLYEQINLQESGIQLGGVIVSARKEQARSDVMVSKLTVTQSQIKALPSTGGEADIAQYLSVLPGIVFTGDQGGQLYIRGGSPVQNKVLLDGMTIYNPFHSIGFFSVFETETIKNVDVLTGGFDAEYGGRISAVVDITTREGNKNRLAGILSANPFQSKVLLEGPIKKFNPETGGSTSFMFTAKRSYIDQTSPLLYGYAVTDDSGTLPFNFTDVYGKISMVGGNGSKLNVFGFNYLDRVNFQDIANLDWNSNGGGVNFKLIPSGSNLTVDGIVGFSNYEVSLVEDDNRPRSSSIGGFNAALNFTSFGNKQEFKYGFDITGFNTDFTFTNFLDQSISQKSFTTEISSYLKYKLILGDLIIEPSVRIQYYASLPEASLEPRFGMKYNINDRLRFKLAGGLYSQNLISSVNERDVVNLFVGFLAGPEEPILAPGTTNQRTESKLQKSRHAVAGLEIHITDKIEFNIEPYFKDFTQIININRNKTEASDPNYAAETGEAYGIDFLLNYRTSDLLVWFTYSYGFVNRDDGFQEYPTIFDRRHNLNSLITYKFGDTGAWEASARWNFGTGFPFTLTQAFFTNYDFSDGLTTDIVEGNAELGTLFSTERNGGRLPDYHRLDISVKRTFTFSERSKLEATASVTNAYDRDNIFFFDRESFERVDQLPILPSLGLAFHF